MTIPEWAAHNYDKIMETKDYSYSLDYGTAQKAKYIGGFRIAFLEYLIKNKICKYSFFLIGALLNEITNNIKAKINNKTKYDVSIYSNVI